MKVTAEDLQRQYECLSDEALLDIRRADLVELAARCYDEELSRRGLRQPAPKGAPVVGPHRPAKPEDGEDFVAVASFKSAPAAQTARRWLASGGIRARLSPDGLTVLTPPSTRDEAWQILNTPSEDAPAADIPSGPTYVRHGMGMIRACLFGFPDLIDFVENTFDALELERYAFGLNSLHVETAIGDSVVVLEIGNTPPAHAAPASITVYVPDTDDTFARALECGGKAVSPPEDKPNHERSAAIRDSFGNTWWIATYHAPPDEAGDSPE